MICYLMDCSPPGTQLMEFSGQKYWSRLLFPTPKFSWRSSRPRDQNGVSCISCIGRQILYHCATWEALWIPTENPNKTLAKIESDNIWKRVQFWPSGIYSRKLESGGGSMRGKSLIQPINSHSLWKKKFYKIWIDTYFLISLLLLRGRNLLNGEILCLWN